MEGIYVAYLTYPHDYLFEARFELMNLLSSLSSNFSFLRTPEKYIIMNPGGFKGILLVDFREIPLDKAERRILRKRILDTYRNMKSRNMLAHIMKFIILDVIVETDLPKLKQAVKELSKRIDGTWRISIRTRKVVDRIETIRILAEQIRLPVDLDDPDYEISIQVLGKLTGVSLIKRKKKLGSDIQ